MKKCYRMVAMLIAMLMAINMCAITPAMAYTENIEGISASLVPTAVIRENESGNMTRDYYAESDTYSDEYFRYYFMDSDFVFTVTYNGGQTFTGDYNEVYEQFGESPWFSDDQSYESQWLAGKHEITVHFMDLTGKVEIEIEKSPIESISVVAKESIVEGTWGQDWKDVIPETGEETESYFRYEVYPDLFEYTLVLENGEIFTGSLMEIQEKFRDSGWNTYPNAVTDQSYDNQWGVGKHAVTVRFMGKSCESEIEIVESPIESISAVAVKTLTEGNDGHIVTDWTIDGQPCEYFRYHINYDTLEYTVTYDGGKTYTGSWTDVQEKFGNNQYYIDVTTYQSFDNQWGVGKHTVDISFMGKSCSTEIEIQKSPIDSISAVAVKTLTEGIDGWVSTIWLPDGQSEQYFKYDINYDTLEYTVIYDGGKTYTGSWTDVQEKFGNNQYYIDVTTDQSFDNQWGVGKHTVDISFMGKSCSVEIEIVKSPIESISAVAVEPLYEGIGGYFTSDYTMEGQTEQYYIYEMVNYPFEITVTYDGGKTYTGSRTDVQEKFGNNQYYIDVTTYQSFDNQWGVGKHNVSVSFLGKRCTAEVEVVETSIESFSAEISRPLLYGIDGDISYEGSDEYFKYAVDDWLIVYNVVYNGGKTFKGNAEEFYIKFSCSPTITDDQSYDNQWGPGKHSVTISFAGASCVAEVEVAQNSYKSLQISGENNLLLTFTKDDNSVVTAKILDFDSRAGSESTALGILTTDIGVFHNARFSWYCEGSWDLDNVNPDITKDVFLSIGTLSSNVLEKNNWLYMSIRSRSIAYFTLAFQKDIDRNILNFDGTITKDNINGIISLSYSVTGKLWGDDIDYITEGQRTYWLYDLDDVKETVSMLFDTTGADFSDARIDAASGKVMVEDVAIGGDGTRKTATSFDDEKNCWSSTTQEFDMNQSARRTLTITYDINNKVSSIVETHEHRLVSHASSEATCENNGSKAYCECTICGKLFTDDTCSKVIAADEILIPATGHLYVDTVVPPTSTEEGYTEHTCSKCGHSYKDDIVPALTPKFIVSSGVGVLGKTVSVNISIENNPGIVTAKLSIAYDRTKLQLLSASDTGLLNDALFGGDINANPYNLYWDDSLSSQNNTGNGAIVTLMFKVLDTSELGDTSISVSYLPDDVYDVDLNNVSFDTVDGTVNIRDVLLGDVDGNGEVTAKDASLLRRYYAGGWNTQIDLVAADVNGDGDVNAKDITMLRRYIAGGWGVVLE